MLRHSAARALLVLALVAASGCELRTLGAPKGSTSLTAEFDDAQHLVPGHAVKVSDVQVGTVTDVRLAGYRAKVTMSIVDGRNIPVGTSATLSQTSLLGESYVRLDLPEGFDPRNGPFLTSGSDITATTVEPSLEHITEQALAVLGAVDGGDLAKIVETLSTGLGGRGDALHKMIGQLADAGQVFAEQSQALGQAVDDIGRLGTTLAASPDTFGTLIDDLDGAAAALAAQRQRFVATLGDLTTLAATLNGKVLDPYGPELRQILVQLGDVTATLAADKATLGSLLTNLSTLAVRARRASDASGAVLIYGWVTAVALPGGGGTVPTALSGSAAVSALLAPTGPTG